MKISISNENKITAARGMTGLFIEDINYAIDGGLYAEMLENANFEARDVSGKFCKPSWMLVIPKLSLNRQSEGLVMRGTRKICKAGRQREGSVLQTEAEVPGS